MFKQQIFIGLTALTLTACGGQSVTSSPATTVSSQVVVASSQATNTSSQASSLLVSSSVVPLSSSVMSVSSSAMSSSSVAVSSTDVASSAAVQSSAGVSSSVPVEASAELFGFANFAANGLQTTTGGASGQVVTVTSFDDLVKYIDAPEPYVVQVSGTITTPDNKYRKLFVSSNKTIIGLGTNATVEHIGFDVTGWRKTHADSLADFCEAEFKTQFTPVQNVIIRNLHFKNTSGNSSDADGIVVQCYSHHVWVDHNSFHGIPSGNDGAIDIKRGADWVTVSWNHIMAWDKSMLLGHVDSNGEQDRGMLHVTYHHNYFENTRQRHPRVRFARAHLLNNYLFNNATVANRTASYFAVAGVEASVNMEGNLIEHAKNTYIIGEESDSNADVTYAASNKVVALAANAMAEFQVLPNGAAFNPADFYSYSVDDADSLRSLIPAKAGAGKM